MSKLALALQEGYEAPKEEDEVRRMIALSEFVPQHIAHQMLAEGGYCRAKENCRCRHDVPHGCPNWRRA